jgi:hypothetical protein
MHFKGKLSEISQAAFEIKIPKSKIESLREMYLPMVKREKELYDVHITSLFTFSHILQKTQPEDRQKIRTSVIFQVTKGKQLITFTCLVQSCVSV